MSTASCRPVPGRPSKHGATIDTHWSRPLCEEHLGRGWERSWASSAKVQASGAVQWVICDPGPARVADTLRNPRWRHAAWIAARVPRRSGMTGCCGSRVPSATATARSASGRASECRPRLFRRRAVSGWLDPRVASRDSKGPHRPTAHETWGPGPPPAGEDRLRERAR